MLRTSAAVLLLALAAPAPRTPPGPTATRVRLVVAPEGNEVRFRVKEQLAMLTMPNVAVGVTGRITGALTLDNGKVVPSESRFSVALDSLKSDRDRRDGYIKHRTLETGRFPTADLAVTALPGLPWPLPDSGTLNFQIVGDLTIHGVTRPSTWQVTAEAKDGGFTGTAATRVKLEDFGMTQPRVAIVLSVEDDIGLEYQFHFIRDPSSR
ncbi:MAG: YceI family protein [Gemmatimonadales bacterium]|jgi:polyisoprenoid-binding protein YceI